MRNLQICTRGVGFAAVASLVATVGLSTAAYADGGLTPGTGPVITNADVVDPGYADTGTTVGKGNNGDGLLAPGCTNGPSASEDAWYQLNITATVNLNIDLCASAYDTKTYILATDFTELACNDHACPGFRSILLVEGLAPGTYYLAVDGGFGESGAYSLLVTEVIGPEECILDPACVGDPEGEACDDVGDDTTNGGCNSTPPVFGSIFLDGNSICGNDWAAGGTRDTDWYQLYPEPGAGSPVLAEETTVEINIRSENPSACFLVSFPDGVGVCTNLGVPGDAGSDSECGTQVAGGGTVPAGAYVIFAGCSPPDGSGIFDGFPCPGPGPVYTGAYELSVVTTAPPPPPCPWDFNADNDVAFADLLQLLANYGCCPGFVSDGGDPPLCIPEIP